MNLKVFSLSSSPSLSSSQTTPKSLLTTTGWGTMTTAPSPAPPCCRCTTCSQAFVLVYFFCGTSQHCCLKIKRLWGNSEVTCMASIPHLCTVEYPALWMVGVFNHKYERACIGAFLPNKSWSCGFASILFTFMLGVYGAKNILKNNGHLFILFQ